MCCTSNTPDHDRQYELRTQNCIQHNTRKELYIYCNIILLPNLVRMTYSCITLWRLNKGSSTAGEQPPYDYNFEIPIINY